MASKPRKRKTVTAETVETVETVAETVETVETAETVAETVETVETVAETAETAETADGDGDGDGIERVARMAETAETAGGIKSAVDLCVKLSADLSAKKAVVKFDIHAILYWHVAIMRGGFDDRIKRARVAVCSACGITTAGGKAGDNYQAARGYLDRAIKGLRDTETDPSAYIQDDTTWQQWYSAENNITTAIMTVAVPAKKAPEKITPDAVRDKALTDAAVENDDLKKVVNESQLIIRDLENQNRDLLAKIAELELIIADKDLKIQDLENQILANK